MQMTVISTMAAIVRPRVIMPWLPMKVITSIPASFAMKGLCETPGLKYAGIRHAPTAAAAVAGRKPARTMIGMIVGPTDAQRPAIEGMAVAMTLVTAIHAGKRKIPMRFKGWVRRRTRCASHLVTEITAAKPMAEQMAMMRLPLVMDLSNCLKAIIGSRLRSAITRPETKSTRRVS